jgi:hypothetical protein
LPLLVLDRTPNKSVILSGAGRALCELRSRRTCGCLCHCSVVVVVAVAFAVVFLLPDEKLASSRPSNRQSHRLLHSGENPRISLLPLPLRLLLQLLFLLVIPEGNLLLSLVLPVLCKHAKSVILTLSLLKGKNPRISLLHSSCLRAQLQPCRSNRSESRLQPLRSAVVFLEGAQPESSFVSDVRFSAVTSFGLRRTSRGFTRNGTIRTKSVKTKKPKGIQSRKNPHGISKKQDLGPRVPISHARTYPTRTLNRTIERVYSADTSSGESQCGHGKNRKIDRVILTGLEHEGHAADSRSNIILITPKLSRQ